MTNTDDEAAPRFAQGRSPAYPYIGLPKALDRAEQIKAAGAARAAMPPETFYKIWELGAQSSGARQTMAALNHFGLVEYIGRGDERKVKLSELALRIVLDKQPGSKERAAAIQQSALMPPIHRELFERYGGLLPADVVIETFLTRDRNYNETAARALIDEFKDTLEFSELDKPDNMQEIERDPPMREKPEADFSMLGPKPPPGQRQPLDDPDPPPSGVRKTVFVVPEGDVAITFPEIMSTHSVEDLEGYIAIWLRQIKREAASTDKKEAAN